MSRQGKKYRMAADELEEDKLYTPAEAVRFCRGDRF